MQAYQARKAASGSSSAPLNPDEAYAKLQRYQEYLSEHKSDEPKPTSSWTRNSGQITTVARPSGGRVRQPPHRRRSVFPNAAAVGIGDRFEKRFATPYTQCETNFVTTFTS